MTGIGFYWGHVATLLSEVRELAEDLAEFLPGITAAGYELAAPVPPAEADRG